MYGGKYSANVERLRALIRTGGISVLETMADEYSDPATDSLRKLGSFRDMIHGLKGYFRNMQIFHVGTEKKLSSLEKKIDAVIPVDHGSHAACYFCLAPVHGKLYILTEEKEIRGRPVEVKYRLDENCYLEARHSQYIGGNPLSLS